MLPWIEPMLYTDPQTQKPLFFCPECATECYASGGLYLRCERRAP